MDGLQQKEMFVQEVGTSGRSSAPRPTDARAARPYLSLQNLSPSRSDNTAGTAVPLEKPSQAALFLRLRLHEYGLGQGENSRMPRQVRIEFPGAI